MPKIISSDFHPDLIQMARNMLQKDWRKRLELSSLDTIRKTMSACLIPQDEPVNLYTFIKTRALPIQSEIEDIQNISRTLKEKTEIKNKLHNSIWQYIDNCFEALRINNIINSIKQSGIFKINEKYNHYAPAKMEYKRGFKIYQIDGKFEYGFARTIFILLKIENDEKNY
jgi:hypothetical protein